MTLGMGDSKVLSVTVAKKSLWIKPIDGDVQKPLDMSFNAKNGDIEMHRWCDDKSSLCFLDFIYRVCRGLLLTSFFFFAFRCDEKSVVVGFSGGFVMGVSTSKSNPGKEPGRPCERALSHSKRDLLTYSPSLSLSRNTGKELFGQYGEIERNRENAY